MCTLSASLHRAVLERSELLQLRWDLWEVSVLLVAFGAAQFVRLSCLHVMIRLSSAAGLNLALLATDFYAVMAGITFFQYKVIRMFLLGCVVNSPLRQEGARWRNSRNLEPFL